jgi:toxin HigB-1
LIVSFNDKETEKLFETGKSRKFSSFRKIAVRKLDLLDAAMSLKDLAVPPNNRLEALEHDRKGQYSIRINDQFRICFVWSESEKSARDVEITDYH